MMSDHEEDMVALEEYKEELKIASVGTKRQTCPLCSIKLERGEKVIRVQIHYFLHAACIGYKKLARLKRQLNEEKQSRDQSLVRARELMGEMLEKMHDHGASEEELYTWEHGIANLW